MKTPLKRKFRTHKIDNNLYLARALPGETAYGKTRRAATRILKFDLGLLTGVLLLLTGCKSTTVYHHTDTTQAGPAYWGSGYAIVNNSGYYLNIVQDGREIAQRIPPGRVFPLKALWLQRISTLTVLAYNSGGGYVGTDSYVFSNRVPETWTISDVLPQGGYR